MNKKKISNTYCSVDGCHSKKGKNPNFSFHLFPRKGLRQVRLNKYAGCEEKMDHHEAWKMALKIDKPIKGHMKVCCLHFQKEDFFLSQYTCKHPSLKKIAIPSLNLPKSSRPGLLTETSIITNMENKLEVSEEDYEVKVEAEGDVKYNFEDLHSSIDIKQEPVFEIGKPITNYMDNLLLLKQFEIKEEVEEEIEFNFDHPQCSVDNIEDPLFF